MPVRAVLAAGVVAALSSVAIVAASTDAATSDHEVRAVFKAAVPNFTRVVATCPSGFRVTGGGAEALGSTAILNGSFPNVTRTGWVAVGHQPGHSNLGLHVYAICERK